MRTLDVVENKLKNLLELHSKAALTAIYYPTNENLHMFETISLELREMTVKYRDVKEVTCAPYIDRMVTKLLTISIQKEQLFNS